MKMSPAFQLLILAVAKASSLKINFQLPLKVDRIAADFGPKRKPLKKPAAEPLTPAAL